MRKIASALAFLFVSHTLICQTILKVGNGQQYSTLQDAYNAIPATINTAYIIRLEAGYNSSFETFPITFGFKAGTTPARTITVQPAVAGLAIAGSNTGASLVFHGAENVILDGRVNGAGQSDLILLNTNNTGNCINIQNGTSNCIIQYCKIQGVSTALGLVEFTYNAAAPTNKLDDNNKIQFNDFSPYLNYCYRFINGDNNRATNTLIYGNTFAEFMKIIASSSIVNRAVSFNKTSTGLTIRANHFFEGTTATTSGSGLCYIYCANAIKKLLIDSNYMGGSQKFSKGNQTKSNPASGTSAFNLISVRALSGVAQTDRHVVRANTLKNIFVSNYKGAFILVEGNSLIESNQLGDPDTARQTVLEPLFVFINADCNTTDLDTVRYNRINRTKIDNRGDPMGNLVVSGIIKNSGFNYRNVIGSQNAGDSVYINSSYLFEGECKSAYSVENSIERTTTGGSVFYNSRYIKNNSFRNSRLGGFVFGNYSSPLPNYIVGNKIDSTELYGYIDLSANAVTADSIKLESNFVTNSKVYDVQGFIHIASTVNLRKTEISRNKFINWKNGIGAGSVIDVSVTSAGIIAEDNEMSNINLSKLTSSRIMSFVYLKPAVAFTTPKTFLVKGNIIRNIFIKELVSNVSVIFCDDEDVKVIGVMEGNIIENIRDSINAGTVSFNIIHCGNMDSISGNVINNISLSSASGELSGINSSNGGGTDSTDVVSNTITGLTFRGSGAGRVYGMNVSGKIEADGNFIGFLHNNSNLGEVAGIFTSYSLFKNNIIALGVDTAGNALALRSSVYGVKINNTRSAIDLWNNTIYIRGAAQNATLRTSCYYDSVVSRNQISRVFNNIFWNATTNGDSTKHSLYYSVSPLNMAADYNIYYKNTGGRLLTYNNGVNWQRTIAQIRSALPGQNGNSGDSAITLQNPDGDEAHINFSPAGTNLIGKGFTSAWVNRDFYKLLRSNPPTIGAIEKVNIVLPVADFYSSNCGSKDTNAVLVIAQNAPYIWTSYRLYYNNTMLASATLVDSDTISGLKNGFYTITYKNGVSGDSVEQQIFISTNEEVTFQLNSRISPDCGGLGQGRAVIVPANGTAAYEFTGIGAPNTTGIYNDLAPGNYTINVKSLEGCRNSINFTITNAPLFVAALDSVKAQTLCLQTNGYIKVSASAGLAPILYNIGTSQNSTGIFSPIGAGQYIVTITDGAGCFQDITVNVPDQNPVVNATVSAISTNTKCKNYNGSVVLQITGTSGNYSYNWSNGSNGQNLIGVKGGSYTAIIKDNSGCADTVSAVVPENVASLSATSTTFVNRECVGGSGSMNVSITGGKSPFTYSWSNGSIKSNLSSVLGGTYRVTITDAAECTVVVQNQVPNDTTGIGVGIKDDEPNTGCKNFNGAATAFYTNGYQPHTYLWSDGNATARHIEMAPGTYTVTITDAAGCTGKSSYTVLEQSPQIDLLYSITNESVAGATDGRAIIYTNIGSSPLAINYNGTIVNDVMYGLAAGNYPITVTDANGCIATGSFTIGVGFNTYIDEVAYPGVKSYPNPTGNMLFVTQGEAVRIFSADGRFLMESVLGVDKSIDVSRLTSGIYIAEVHASGRAFRIRWFKI